MKKPIFLKMQHSSDIAFATPTAVTVGTFDGVHRGHCKVVEFLVSQSAESGLHPVVITFEPHPLAIVAPARAPKLLELPKEREKNLRSLGAEVIVLEFNEALRRLTATEWMERLAKEYNARLLVTGYDNTFGSDGMSMNISDYSRIGKDYGIKVVEAPIVEGVSSSAIRRALGAGDVETAASMLGRPYSVSGNVGHGRELGRQLGFPTANLITDPDSLLPAPGVYAAEATTTDGNQYRAVVNIGVSPTVSEGLPLSVEAYLINYSGNLYGTNLRLDFLRRLRDEKKFGDISALKAGIAADVRAASEINVD